MPASLINSVPNAAPLINIPYCYYYEAVTRAFLRRNTFELSIVNFNSVVVLYDFDTLSIVIEPGTVFTNSLANSLILINVSALDTSFIN